MMPDQDPRIVDEGVTRRDETVTHLQITALGVDVKRDVNRPMLRRSRGGMPYWRRRQITRPEQIARRQK